MSESVEIIWYLLHNSGFTILHVVNISEIVSMLDSLKVEDPGTTSFHPKTGSNKYIKV